MGEIAEALKKANAERELRSLEQGRPPEQAVNSWPGESADARNGRTETRAADALSETEPELQGRVGTIGSLPHIDKVLVHIEQHRHLALRIRAELERRGARSLVVASALRNEGKTTVSCNLAAALASLSNERNVALLDLDLRNPSLAAQLGVDVSVGVESVLLGRVGLDQVRLSFGHPALDFYPGREPQKAAHELLVLPAFAEMLQELESRYSVVVIDTPPSIVVPDSTLVLRQAAACLAVARAGETRVKRFREMLDLLPEDQLIGKVLNHTPAPKHRRDSYYYDDDEEGKSS